MEEKMLILNYPSKKVLKECIGEELDYTETSFFGIEFKSDGRVAGSNRPNSPEFPKIEKRKGREFYASVVMKDGIITKVE